MAHEANPTPVKVGVHESALFSIERECVRVWRLERSRPGLARPLGRHGTRRTNPRQRWSVVRVLTPRRLAKRGLGLRRSGARHGVLPGHLGDLIAVCFVPEMEESD